MSLRVIPVLDLKQGRAVHAIGGDRAHYQPLRSRLHASSDPIALARAGRDRFGFRELYLADLDAIAGAPLGVRIYQELRDLGLHVWVDAGVRDRASLPPLLESGVGSVVVGLETISGPGALADVVTAAGPGRVVFSLDLKDGRPLTAPGADWGTGEPESLAATAVGAGIRRLILLDLARVGTGGGPGTLSLLERFSAAHPGLEITVGGGIAGMQDLARLAGLGVSAVLVGSALYDGRIGPEMLHDFGLT